MKIRLILVLLGFILLTSFLSAKAIIIQYPSNVSYNSTFQVNITLVNFTEEIYDVKIDIFNFSNSADRFAQIYTGSAWQSTFNYLIGAINTSKSNSSNFTLNLTKNIDAIANLTLKLRSESEINTTYYTINLNWINMTSNSTNSTNTTCTQSWSCGSWSSCSGSTQTRTCTDSNNCGNTTGKPSESQSCTNVNASVDLGMEWIDENIINGQEFDITVKAYNLQNADYDLKVWIRFEDNETILSERYDSNSSEWRSGTYYLSDFFTDPGNVTKTIKIRISEEFRSYYGEAEIYARLRKSGDIVKENSRTIDILQASNSSSSSSNNQTTQTQIANETTASPQTKTEVIVLGGTPKIETGKNEENTNSIIYKSKTEYIREYAPYLFGLVCIVLIGLVLYDGHITKPRIEKNNNKKHGYRRKKY